MNKAAQAYFQTKVNTTDQGQLLLLLYDGALKFLQQAREKMLVNDYAAKGILISKVIDIINELTNTLNLEKGGSLAENLNNLYFLCTTRLLQANLKMSVEQLDNVASILSGLRSAYAEIIETPEARKVSAQISAKLNVDASVTQRAAIQTKQTATPTTLGKMQARNAYGAMQRSAQPMQTPQTAPASDAALPGVNNQENLMASAQAPVQNVTPQTQDLQQDTAQVAKSAAIPFTQSVAPAAQVAEGVAQNKTQAPVASAATTATTAPTTSAPPTTSAKPATKTGFGVSGFPYPKAFGK